MTIIVPNRYETLPSTITVVSPLVHSDERLEVMQRFRREPYWLDGERLDIPVYSGNAIRGMLRRACALRVCEALGIEDETLGTEPFYLLFSGGYLEGRDHAARIGAMRELRQALPHLALLGCSRGTQITHGLVDIWRGVPVCQELSDAPRHAGHPAYNEPPVPSVFDLIGEMSYSRRDDRADRGAGAEQPTVQMRYAHEVLIPGTRLLHGARLRTDDPLVIGSLVDAIALCGAWDSLGGRAAIGHGQFEWTWDALAKERASEREAYLRHLVDADGAIRAQLGISVEVIPAQPGAGVDAPSAQLGDAVVAGG